MSKNTLTKRATKASAKQAGALGLFQAAATQLEAAADEHSAVKHEALAIAQQHTDVAQDSAIAQEQALAAAAKIRELVG